MHNNNWGFSKKPKDYQILFLDMNSFFASVEQQVQPTLRGIPVGITPYTGDTGCIIAASYEAKNQGVKTGTLVGEAKKICPKIKIIESRPALYTIYHQEIKKVLKNLTPFYQPLSIDEFLINLSPSEQNHQSSKNLALKIKREIYSSVGDYLKCSIGIGPNRFLAKMAGESQKPNGLTILNLKNLKDFYQKMPQLTNITGINCRLEKHLKKFQIDSPIRLYKTPLIRLRQTLNHLGRVWYYRLRGYEVDNWKSKTKTIGHSHVLAPEFRNQLGAKSVLKKLIYKVGYRLRKGDFNARGISVGIQFMNRTGFYKTKAVPQFSDNASLNHWTFEVLKECKWLAKPILVSVSVFNLEKSGNMQISIFEDLEKSKKISQTLDRLSDEYGPQVIFPASIFNAKESAPDRIPFGQPRYDIRNY